MKDGNRVDNFWMPLFNELAKKMNTTPQEAALAMMEAIRDEAEEMENRDRQAAMGLPVDRFGIIPPKD